ncbi:hypothetical protein PhaeoP57_00171 [Phaeobacter inhibens]|uniref:hypothetical protein n=1 Tax=Phaeobacter inhibens TaxID=221822 RepID=UPI000C9C7D26|nr:hypothetical protein [Phaeobacter inhibens]AUQ64860.1 hypothetical protein PhaeoP51_03933 [Phaeobacter inhibens]AUQ81137.1 hypothetical protein PhaeoP57_00171 [Phaeobacter inhibens]AUQ92494.1 hypothetical protein PhaeoP24_03936 [Phaeobacter inhibens]AUQ92619.1 hypothetical protein PhaeoP24_04061 [Phaeobacter inhibens]
MRGRPRRGHVAGFGPEDGVLEEPAPSSITGLRFCVNARSGGAAELDFTDLGPRALAIEIAQALRRLSEVGGPLGARSTILAYARTVRIFFRYMAVEAPTVSSSGQIVAQYIDGFEAWLEAEGKSRVHAFTQLSKIVVIFREIDANDPNRVSDDLRGRLRYTSARPFERSKPRDAYSPYVARQLRDAARADVAAMLRRLDGCLPETIAAHSDPVVCQRAAVLHEGVRSRGFLPRDDKATRDLYRALYTRGLPTSSLLEDVYSRFYLTVHDLPPLLTLLSLDTGLEIECVKALNADCLSSASAGTVTLHYTKRRAHGLAQKTMRVRDGGPTTPGGLIRAIVTMTERARQFHPSDALFVFYNACGFRDVVRHPGPTLRHWIARHSIVADHGQPLKLLLSRLRKTHKALWYLKTNGHMARFAVGHTTEIAARHYADIPSLRPLHETTIADGLEDAIGLDTQQEPHPDQEHAVPAAHLQTGGNVASAGAQDVWLASCSGFYDSPFYRPGAPCAHPFWGCLECRNAVISERKLPAILSFLDFILSQRTSIHAQDWAAKFGHAHERITRQILPAFSDEVIGSARATLEAHPPMVYLPPEAAQ